MIMRRFSTYVVSGLVAFLLAVVLASGSRFNAPTFDGSSVVMIMNGSHHGSGFHIGGGKILTAAHVVEDGDIFPVLIEAKGTVRTVDGKVAWVDKDYDLALVVVPTVVFPSVDLSCRQPVIGEQVEAVGYPLDVGLAHTWGRVSAPERERGDWLNSFIVDMTIGLGMSGGPLLDRREAKAVGVVVGVYKFVPFSIVVPSTVACFLIESHAETR
jgi:S1-C subfamily serine protease